MTAYAELHCKTNYSFLEGASHADELVATAQKCGYRAIAVTDRDSLAGVVRAHVAAKEHGLKLIVGAELHLSDAPPVVVWATDRQAYGRLCRLITVGRRRAEKGSCDLAFADLAEHAEGLIAGVVPVSRDAESAERSAFSGSLSRSGERVGVRGITLQSRSYPSPPTPLPRAGEGRDFKRSADSASRLTAFRDLFGDRAYLLAELFRGPNDARRLERLQHLSRQTGLPLLATNDVHYHSPARLPLHDVLTAIRHGTPVAASGDALFPNAERHLRALDEIAAAFAAAPEAVRRTVEVADRCTFSLDELRYEYPEELVPAGRTSGEYLAEQTWRGAAERYPSGMPEKVRRLVAHELSLIEELRYEAYFLTVHDLVRFARERNILCQGRGSAANSAVCYCLGVTSVDPDRIDVLFERFMSKERAEAPDIDVDFEHERREEVLQYLYEKYGRERAGLAATVITYCARSAVRDVGKALGLSLDRVDALAKQVEGYRTETLLAERCAAVGIDPASPVGLRLIYLVNEILGFPRHLSQHVGGMILTQGPLCEVVPIENAAMPDRTVVQWDKNDLDALGILKVDVLALGMLSAIRKCFDLVNGFKEPNPPAPFPKREGGENQRVFLESSPPSLLGKGAGGLGSSAVLESSPPSLLGKGARGLGSLAVLESSPPSLLGKGAGGLGSSSLPLTLATVPPEDPLVYDMCCEADTIGVFQIESRGQMSMLPRLKPRCYYDLVIEVAIMRPGPIQGQMVHPFLRRRNGEEEPVYPNDEIRAVLHKTLGVPLFQEQAMKLAVVAAGFTPGEADQLRRAMGAWRRSGVIEQFRVKMMEGMKARGLSAQFAEQVFTQIRGFGEYGFPESHAASFALLVYVSAWLKRYYPAAFAAALLNSQPMGFYAPAQLVGDARRHGVPVRPVDVNCSDWDCTLELSVLSAECSVLSENNAQLSTQHSALSTQALRLGFRMVGGLRSVAADAIVAARADGPFRSVADLARRARLGRATLEVLADADAFGSLTLDRRAALWESLGQDRGPPNAPLFAGLDDDEPPADLPPLAPVEQVIADYHTTGLSLKGHPMTFCRGDLDQLGVVKAEQLAKLPHGRRVLVAGIVLVRQRPSTAKGITFVTLEDETGTANLVVRQSTWERYYAVARRSPAWVASGVVERKDAVVHVLVHRLDDLSAALGDLRTRSRDFR